MHPVITAYAGAVAAMQAKSADDPTSWSYQVRPAPGVQRPGQVGMAPVVAVADQDAL
jgi:hypothetical protein